MYTAAIFTWTLMAATRALKIMPSCLKLCDSIHRVNSRPVACNCAGPVQHVDISTSYENEDKGVYYLPEDSAPNQSIIIPLSGLNANVQNKTMKSNYRPNLEGLQLYGKNSDLSELKSEGRGMNRTKKHEQTDAYNKDTQTTSTKPLYLDIEIRKIETSETFSREPKTGTVYQEKEKYLEDCLDIHTVLHSRRSHTIPNLREKWSTEKLDKYVNLSDAELLKESNQRCSHSNDVLKQSMNEIKQSLPAKLGSSKLHVKNSVNHHSYSKVSSILPEHTVNTKSTSTGRHININNSGTSTSVVTNEEHTHSNSTKKHSTLKVDDKRPPVDWSKVVEANDTKTLKGNLENVTIISTSTGPMDDTSTMNSLFITQETNFISSIDMKGIQRKINSGSEIYTVNPIHKTSTDELTGMTTNVPINQYYGNVALNSPENIEHNDNNIHTSSLEYTTEIVNNMTVLTTTVTDCDNCTELAVTKKAFPDLEFLNIPTDTVPTDALFEVTASTSTPFAIPAFTLTKSATNENVSGDTSLSPYETTTEVSVNLIGDNSNSKTSELELVEDPSVTGSLYFNFRNQNIPARFIQDPAGHINISIDVIALCDKLNLSSNGSVLIGVMCKCVQSKTCT